MISKTASPSETSTRSKPSSFAMGGGASSPAIMRFRKSIPLSSRATAAEGRGSLHVIVLLDSLMSVSVRAASSPGDRQPWADARYGSTNGDRTCERRSHAGVEENAAVVEENVDRPEAVDRRDRDSGVV